MRYDDHIIDQVQSANDIADVISQYLPLKRAGRNMKACCPFHEEKTASFMVQPEKQIFHCFGCGVGGNVFSFLMKYENISFPEAMRQLAERAHIDLPKPTGKSSEGPSIYEQLYEVYRHAAEYYHAQFMHEKLGKSARDYFLKRQFSLELAKEMKMGWARNEWRGLFEYLSKKGFSNELLVKSSLVQRSPKGHFYDTFRGRLLFPIQNLAGKVVAFGGRLVGSEDGPKYLNSPENPVFRKRKELFGLSLSKRFVNRDLRQILIGEGYFDFLRLYQHGFKNAVATLGTALTEDHVQLLKRFADEAIVVYDGDKAGEAASLRGLEVFLEGDMNVKVIRLPDGFDPDDYVAQNGAEKFKELIASARDFFDYKFEILMGRYNHNDSLGLMKITNEFLETFVKVKNPILLDRYLRKLSASLGVDETSLRTELTKLKGKYQKGTVPATKTPQAKPQQKILWDIAKADLILFTLMVEDAELLQKALALLSEDDFNEAWAKELYTMIRVASEQGQTLNFSTILNRMPEDKIKQQLTSFFSLDWNHEEKEKAFEDCLQTLGQRKTKKRLEELRRGIARAEKSGDVGQVQAFIEEYQDLLKKA